MDDLITRLGHLTMGSRLKRLGEQMQAGVTATLAARGYAIQNGHVALLHQLAEGGPATIGALSDRIGVSQPGISRAAARLEQLGLTVSVESDGGDRRQRAIALSETGKGLIAELHTSLFPAVLAAVRQLSRLHDGGDLLDVVTQVEQGLRASDMKRRIADHWEQAA